MCCNRLRPAWVGSYPIAWAVAAAKGYSGISPPEAIPAADRERDRGPAPAQVRAGRESGFVKPQIYPVEATHPVRHCHVSL
jgi:hypothetical protein